MSVYQITDLEQLTGIKAHTIRIWEKRYQLIEPERTSTNIRRYSDQQVVKLLNVSTLLANGYKISKIAELPEKDMKKLIGELQTNGSVDAVCTSFINELAAAMLRFDEAAFEKTYGVVVERFGLYDAMLQVFYPLFHKIGLMWVVNELSPVQEHFASGIIKRKLMTAIDGLPIPTNSRKKFLLLLPPDEWHDISLLFANYILKAKGYTTIYLGQNVPYENVDAVLKEIPINYVIMFFVTNQDPNQVYNELKKSIHLSNQIQLLVSGNPLITSYLSQKKLAKVMHSPADLLLYL